MPERSADVPTRAGQHETGQHETGRRAVGPRVAVRWAGGALTLALGLSLTACTSHKPGGQSATTSGPALPSASSVASPQNPAAPSGVHDARSDPGADASGMNWVDISQQVNAALKSGGLSTKRKLSFARGELKVPLDWAHAGNGKTVTITAVRIRAANQHDRIGSLVVNPGGPGGSGLDAALQLATSELPDAILGRFDIVGFDPRGVGASDPINCIPAKQKDAELNLPADPTTDAQWNADLADDQKTADECFATYGNDLTYFSTAETVRDMEALRSKLGDLKLSYLGYSYGTLLGAEYASAYPDKVRALVLDGAVDPTISSLQQDKTQAAGFQLAFSHFAAACTKQGSACKLGADPQAFVQKLMTDADAHPIPSGDSSDHRTAKGAAVLLAVISALYDQSQWDQLTTALVDASHGDASGVLALDDQYNERQQNGTYTNIEDANVTIGCADETDRIGVAQARQLQPQWRADSPLFGGSAAASAPFCSLWKAPPDTPITVTNSHAPPVLVVGTTGDPATPISGARHLAQLLGSGDLLVWQGDGHTAYPKTTCITNAVDSYLIDLKAPAAGTTCPAS